MARQFCVAIQSLTLGEYGVLRQEAVYQLLIYIAGEVIGLPHLQSQHCVPDSLHPFMMLCCNNCSSHKEDQIKGFCSLSPSHSHKCNIL